MKRLLHIVASPRGGDSRTLQVSRTFLNTFQEEHPDWIVDELNLIKEKLPELSMKAVSGKYVLLGGKELFGSQREAWTGILQQIERFKSSDLFLVSSPMWNFSIPYMLKHYLDLIVQPKYLFRYTESGSVEGLVKDRKMVIITSRGGQYTGQSKTYDFQEPYLKHIFGFVGIQDITFINAEPMDMGAELQKEKLEQAKERAKQVCLEIFR